MKLFPKKKNETFLLDGLSGRLEIMTTQAKSERRITGIICHPHPLYGGTMHNKVVTTVAKAFEQLGVKTVRFNFRSVGKSEACYDNTLDETDDLKAILGWVTEVCPSDEIWLAGFSFGSYVATKVANTDLNIKQLITVAPTVNNYDYQSVKNITCPWLVVLGSQDEFVPLEEVGVFIKQSPASMRCVVIEGASHFFHGSLIKLRAVLIRELPNLN